MKLCRHLASLIATLLALITTAAAQEPLRGVVVDTEGQPIIGAVIKIVDTGEAIKAFGTTDGNGAFAIKLPDTRGPLTLKCSYIGYAATEHKVTDRSAVQRIVMAHAPFKLREVTVRAPALRSHGDTIVYNVASFKSAADRNIEDVIKRMPGIEVESTGRINYNGNPINKFYIEGLDLLSGRYALATRNISPDDIASVSVYENHQPKKVLENISFSDRAALNLTLKKKRMLKPVGYVTGGAGAGDHKALWLGELHAMLITPKRQALVTAKGNNFGQTYTDELRSFDQSSSAISSTSTMAGNLFQTTPFGTARIPQSRYYRNSSQSASVNAIQKTSANLNITVNATWLHDRDSYTNNTVTEYFGVDGGRLTTTEAAGSHLDSHEATVTVKAEHNAPSLYFTDQLQAKGRFARNHYSLDARTPLTQRLHTDNFAVANTFNTIVRRGKRLFEFGSVITIADTPTGYMKATATDGDSLIVDQKAGGLRFRTRENTSLAWSLTSSSSIGAALTFESDYERIDTRMLRGEGRGDENDNHGYRLVTSAAPYYQFSANSLRWRIEVPVRMYDMRFTNLLDGTHHSHHRPYVDARTTLSYTLPNNLKLALGAGNSYTIGTMRDFVTNPVATTYRRTTTLGAGHLQVRRSINASLSANYRNTMQGLFLTGRANYIRNTTNRMADVTVTPDATVTTQSTHDNTTHTVDCYLNGSKNVQPINTTLRLTLNSTWNRRQMMRQSVHYRVDSRLYSADASIRSVWPGSIVITDLGAKYTVNRQSGTASDASSINDLTGSLDVSVFPLPKFEIYVKTSYSDITLANRTHKRDLYIDGGMRYTGRPVEIELKLNNLTDRRVYTYSTFNDGDTYIYTFDLRPVEFMLSAKYSF